jgi:hypothetical protein
VAPSFEIPAAFWRVPYCASRHPCAPDVAGLSQGANCQLFAYELLRHNGFEPPRLRSLELWDDREATAEVKVLLPGDLLLFNSTRTAFSAHLAVAFDAHRAIHLSRQVGFPAIWSLSDFAAQPRYRCFIGAKRVLRCFITVRAMSQDTAGD